MSWMVSMLGIVGSRSLEHLKSSQLLQSLPVKNSAISFTLHSVIPLIPSTRPTWLPVGVSIKTMIQVKATHCYHSEQVFTNAKCGSH